MGDIQDPKIIWTKGTLFLCLGLMSAGLLLAESFSLRILLLLSISIWAFCRAYYFAFYVIENYVDTNYKFAGLLDFLKYAISRRTSGNE